MFGKLREQLKKSVEKLSKKAEEKEEEIQKEEKPEQRMKKYAEPKTKEPELPKNMQDEPRIFPEPPKKDKYESKAKETRKEPVFEKILQNPTEKKERLSFRQKFTIKTLSEKDIDEFFDENEIGLFQSDVALEVVDFLRKKMKEILTGRYAKRRHVSDEISNALKESLVEVVSHGEIDLENIIKSAASEQRPATMIFLGFNGSGKTTTIARVAKHLMDKKHKPVLAAADTFRAAAIEQLEIHGERLGVKVIKHQYGADSAAVIFDATKYAKSKGFDVVLADTAGRTHTDKNLIDELKKIVRVNKPDLKILVVDSLTGNDAVYQARNFNEAVGIDAVIMTKTDVNEKGGSILSVAYAIKKPIIFLGTGQEYEDLKPFDSEDFVKKLIE